MVLLGNFNGQNLSESLSANIKQIAYNKNPSSPIDEEKIRNQADKTDVEIWLRIVPDVEYIKLVVFHGNIVGAMLVGDTNLEETFENLILNKVDVGSIGIQLLDPDIDIEDYFD